MRIILDMDQVLVKWAERVIEWWNEDNKTSLTVEDMTSWEMSSNLGPGGEYFIRSVMRYPEFYRDLEPIDGAINGVQRLMMGGHDVYIATAIPKCAPIAYAGKIEWIRRNMPLFPVDRLIGIKHKFVLQGDVLFDDGLHNIVPWAASGRTAVIMDCAWNRDIVRGPNCDGDCGCGHCLISSKWAPSKIHRVLHWNEFIKLVDILNISPKGKV